MSDQAPSKVVLQRHVPAVGTAGNDAETVIGKVHFDAAGSAGTIDSVEYIPDSTQAGANTNSRTVTLYNRGGAGAGTTVAAELALTSGVDLTAYVPKTITNSGTAANLVVADGDVLAFKSLHVSNGIADPGGLVRVTISRS